jgi:hypothetical protein
MQVQRVLRTRPQALRAQPTNARGSKQNASAAEIVQAICKCQYRGNRFIFIISW